jgi:hypothetical protein
MSTLQPIVAQISFGSMSTATQLWCGSIPHDLEEDEVLQQLKLSGVFCSRIHLRKRGKGQDRFISSDHCAHQMKLTSFRKYKRHHARVLLPFIVAVSI